LQLYISKAAIATAADSLKHLYEKNNFYHPVTLAWFSIQILVNSKLFKLSCNPFLKHLRAQIVCYELKGDLSPVMLKEIFHDSFENIEFTRICMENHERVTGWQKLFFGSIGPYCKHYKCINFSMQISQPLEDGTNNSYF